MDVSIYGKIKIRQFAHFKPLKIEDTKAKRKIEDFKENNVISRKHLIRVDN